jgi:hypothetical protein
MRRRLTFVPIFLKNPTAVITISHVTSLSQEVYKKLGGDPNAPLLKVENW